ncbi:MAG: LysM peptidoglycan-binding domain-containing protein [Candidatus Obscuribacterales bacterium]|nr:LysM peptidoglycan-binding domain-containing protein [Candidatus Obscuribacterales bacterium]
MVLNHCHSLVTVSLKLEQQGAASDPKWGAARERLTKSDSQKSEIREKGYRAIQYGDTLSDIAKAHLELKNGGKPASGAEVWKEVERLAKLNNLDPRKNIRPGTKIYMEKCDDQNQQPKPDVQPNTEQPAGPARDSRKDGGGKTDRTPAQLETQPAKPEPNEGRGGGKTATDSPPSSRDSRDIDRDGPKSGIQPGSEVSTDPEVKESDKSEDHPPVNFTPDTPTDETSNHEDTHKSETERIARDQKEREKALHAKEEELKRREEDLKRQLEDLQRQKEELGRREKEVKPCSTKDDTTIWEH